MIKFKQYLKEYALKEYAMFSTSDYVFDPNGYGNENANALKIPISGPMFKRIWPDTIRATVFHATTPELLNYLKKLEGKKKSISAFFSMSAQAIEGGIATEGGVVAELDADILISAKDDIMSQVDKTGRRWVELSWFENALGNIKSPVVKKVEKDLNSLIMTLVKKYLVNGISEGFITEIDWEAEKAKDKAFQAAARAKRMKKTKLVIKNVGDAFDAWSEMKRHLKGDGKILRLVIKDYFDGVEKILKKHKKGLTAIFYGYVKSKRQTDSGWDEQIVNNIKVKKIHHLQNLFDDENKEELEALSTAYPKPAMSKVHDSYTDMEIYIRGIVKKERGKKV